MEDKIPVSVQLPEELKNKLALIAKAEGRSLASQIRLFLADAVTQHNTAASAKAA
jgi:hypothetical protein